MNVAQQHAAFAVRVARRAFRGALAAAVAAAVTVVALADGGSERLVKLLEIGRTAVAEGDFAEAVDSFEILAGASDDPAFERDVARWLDRARRSLALVDALPTLLAERPPKSKPSLRLRDGNRGDFACSDGIELVLSIDGHEQPCPARALHPTAVVDLAGRVPLTPELSLARAFVALEPRDEDRFWIALERAASVPQLKASVDSAIAWQRGLDRVPAGGFVRVGKAWKSGAEIALKAELGDPRKLLAALRSARPAEAEAARTKLDAVLRSAPDALRDWAVARRLELKAAFAAAPEQALLAELRTKAALLVEARRHALELIRDETRYWYPYHPPEGPADRYPAYLEVQAEVERRVAAVRALWGAEEGEPPAPVIRAPAFLAVVAELHQLRALLLDLGEPRDEIDRALDPAWHLEGGAIALSIRNVGHDLFEVGRLLRDRPVVASNVARAALAAKAPPGAAQPDELRQLALTNAYRAMMGRRQLLWNDRLHAAAVGHSRWMIDHGTFSHFEGEEGSPRYDPSARAKLAGYPSGAGENIFHGSPSPDDAHRAWYGSSGHHRNLLHDGYTELASGRVDGHWAQLLGGSMEYRANLLPGDRGGSSGGQ
ncbi:MAG: CAP domain-containing protein [Planctomycetes bacterium]|nr:CAP domain-containing protein [Planctomycetota bacterium]